MSDNTQDQYLQRIWKKTVDAETRLKDMTRTLEEVERKVNKIKERTLSSGDFIFGFCILAFTIGAAIMISNTAQSNEISDWLHLIEGTLTNTIEDNADTRPTLIQPQHEPLPEIEVGNQSCIETNMEMSPKLRSTLEFYKLAC